MYAFLLESQDKGFKSFLLRVKFLEGNWQNWGKELQKAKPIGRTGQTPELNQSCFSSHFYNNLNPFPSIWQIC